MTDLACHVPGPLVAGPQAESVAPEQPERTRRGAPDAVLQETAPVGDHDFGQQRGPNSRALQALAEDHVLEHRHIGKSTDPVEHRACREDRVIAVIDAIEPALEVVAGGNGTQTPIPLCKAVRESSRCDATRHGALDGTDRALGQACVGMQEQQDVAVRAGDPRIELSAASFAAADAVHCGNRASGGHCVVGASSVHQHDLAVARLMQQRAQRLADDARLVEHRNDDRNHVA